MKKQEPTPKNKTTKRLTSDDQRAKVSIMFCALFCAFMLLSLIFGAVAAAMKDNTLPLILVAICMAIGIFFASLLVWMEYQEYFGK